MKIQYIKRGSIWALTLFCGISFGYAYRTSQLNLLLGSDISWIGFSEYFFYFVIGVLFTSSLYLFSNLLLSPKEDLSRVKVFAVIPAIALGLIPLFNGPEGIRIALNFVLVWLFILALIFVVRNRASIFETEGVKMGLLLGGLSVFFWQITLLLPIVGYAEIQMARQLASIGLYHQFPSMNLTQYSGALPFIYANTHHHVFAYVLGLLGFSPQSGLFDFLLSNLYVLVSLFISTFCLFLYLKRELKSRDSVATIACILFFSNFYLYGVLGSGEKIHCYNYLLFPLVLLLFETGLRKGSFPLTFLAGLLNHAPNALFFSFPENFYIFDIILGILFLLRLRENSRSVKYYCLLGFAYMLGALSLAFWYLPLLDFVFNHSESVDTGGLARRQSTFENGYGTHLPFIYPVYVGFISILGAISVLVFYVARIYKKGKSAFSLNTETIWLIIFIILVLTSLGYDFPLHKWLKINDLHYPYTRIWSRFGAGYSFVSIIVACVGLNIFLKKFSERQLFGPACLLLSLAPLILIFSEGILGTLEIFQKFGSGGLYLGFRKEPLVYLGSKNYLYIAFILPLLFLFFAKTIGEGKTRRGVGVLVALFISYYVLSVFVGDFFILLISVLGIAVVIILLSKRSELAKSGTALELTLVLVTMVGAFPVYQKNTENLEARNQNIGPYRLTETFSGSRYGALSFEALAYVTQHLHDTAFRDVVDVSLEKAGLNPLTSYLNENNRNDCKAALALMKAIDPSYQGDAAKFGREESFFENAYPSVCWTRFVEILRPENRETYGRGFMSYTFHQSMLPTVNNVFNVGGNSGRTEWWRWFSEYDRYLPSNRGDDMSFYLSFEDAKTGTVLEDLRVSRIQMLREDYDLFKEEEVAKRFSVFRNMKTNSGVEYVFLEDKDTKPLVYLACKDDELILLEDDVMSCEKNHNSLKIEDMRGNFIALELNIQDADNLRMAIVNHRDWRLINLSSVVVKENQSEALMDYPVSAGGGTLIFEFSSRPVKIGCLVFWILFVWCLAMSHRQRFGVKQVESLNESQV